MQYARLGNTGLIVSRLCLGTMTFGLDAGIPALNKVDIESAGIMIRDSMETGANNRRLPVSGALQMSRSRAARAPRLSVESNVQMLRAPQAQSADHRCGLFGINA